MKIYNTDLMAESQNLFGYDTGQSKIILTKGLRKIVWYFFLMCKDAENW